jgi:hypothetical protein
VRERDEHNTREDDNDAGEKMFLEKKIKKILRISFLKPGLIGNELCMTGPNG